MFERNEVITEMVDRLYRECSRLDRGDYLTHDIIRAIVGVEPHETPWPTVMKRLRRRLERERGIATWPEPTVGYKLLTCQEQIEMLPAKRAARADRQYRRAVRSVAACPINKLSLHQRRLQAAQLETMRRAAKEARAYRRLQAKLVRATAKVPRAAVQAARPEALAAP